MKNTSAIKTLVICLLALPVTTGCKKGNNQTTNGNQTTGGHDVYIVGFQSHIVPNVATVNDLVYWKNGQPVAINSTTATDGYPTGIVVYNSDVLAIGNLGAYQSLVTPVYWENGGGWQLYEASQYYASVGNAVVAGSDLYIAGTKNNQAIYWKNFVSVSFSVPANTLASHGSSVAISGSDVYVAGWLEDNKGNYSACYWKNGQIVVLGSGYGYSMAVSGSDVYVAGVVGGNTTPAESVYWKNGQQVLLATNSRCTGIAVSGSDVYVCGFAYNTTSKTSEAVYWKNGQAINLSSPLSATFSPSAIAVSGTDVYVIGNQNNMVNAVGYWKNGQYVTLPPLDNGILNGYYTVNAITIN